MKKIFFLLSVCLLQQIIYAQETATKLDEFLNAYAKQNKFNGTALVAQKGKILVEKGYGLKDAKLGTPDDANTIYQIGSVTKQFTSAIILRLQEEGKLSVKDKLSKYFPDFPRGGKITIENLLTHTSGIYNYTNDTAFMAHEVTHYYTRDKMMALFKNKPLDFEPGAKWSYSNSGYSMLGYIIEKVTGKSYEQMVHQVIFQPLHMNHSGFDFTHLESADKALGYLQLDDKNKKLAPIVDSSVSFSAGAMFSTVGDLYKWDRSIYSNTVLKPESWKQAFTPFRNKYGYGWGIDSMYNRLTTGHSGGIHGFNSNLLRFPQDELVIILLSNKNNGSLEEITRGLAAIVLDREYTLPKERVSVTVKDSILQKYAGEYELTAFLIITITLENGNLKAQLTGQPAFDLFAERDNFFFLKAVDAQIEFINNEDGKTGQLILYQGGRKTPAKKIK